MRPLKTLLPLVLFTASVAPGQPAGEAFRPAGGQYSVRFPGKPKESSQSTTAAVGELKVHTATFATADGAVYLVSYTDFPAGAIKLETIPTLLNGARDGLAGKGGKVVSEKDIALGAGKTAGREVVVDKGKQQTRFRMLVKGNRFYEIAAVGAGEFVTGKGVTAFLDSFELVE